MLNTPHKEGLVPMATARTRNLSSRVYDHLHEQLTARRLPLGSHLNSLRIGRELGVSHTTVNKALARLIDEGWVRRDESRHPIVVGCPRQRKRSKRRPFEFSNQTQSTYRSIYERLVEGRYSQGNMIAARPLADDLGVSVGTVRQALEWLSKDGLTVRLPRRGWQVILISDDDRKDIYLCRLQLEPLALKRAIGRMDERALDELVAENERVFARRTATEYDRRQADYAIHRAIVDHAESPILTEQLDLLLRKAILMTPLHAEVNEAAYSEHKTILECIRQRDVRPATRALKDHLSWVLQMG